MAPLISVLLTTIRPHLVKRALDSIRPAAAGLPYEVVVVADFAPPDGVLQPPVSWSMRDRRGVVDAVNTAGQAALGEYWFIFNDESTLEPGALGLLYEAAVDEPDALLTPEHVPAFPFFYYGLPFAPFPFAHRSVFTQLGGLLDPIYRSFYADPDLSLRAHAQGRAVRTVHGAVIRHANYHDQPHADSVSAYLAADRAAFAARWAHLGELVDP